MSFTSGPGGTLEESPALVALHDVDAAIGRLAETNLWAIPASELLRPTAGQAESEPEQLLRPVD